MSEGQPNMRLELLKLTYSHGREPSEAIARAEELEKYVLAGSKGPGKTPTTPRKPEARPDR